MGRPKLPPGVLTPRERELLPLFAQGLTVKEVGEQVGIARNTASVHKFNIMHKLGVHNARDLAAHVADDTPPWEP